MQLMRITSRLLPPELVQEVKDSARAQVAADSKVLCALADASRNQAEADLLAVIFDYGVADREAINRAISEGRVIFGECYEKCHHCCSMSRQYEVETFDILLACWINSEPVHQAYQQGKFDPSNDWCGLLDKGLCLIHPYKPYTCLLTTPSPKGAERGGCYFRGDRNAKMSVHQQTMAVTERMRLLFKRWLPELPEFVGRNINQAFRWAVETRSWLFQGSVNGGTYPDSAR